MIKRVGVIIHCAIIAQRVGRMGKCRSHPTGRIEQPYQSDSARRVKAIGILDQLGFDCQGPDAGGKAVGLDGVDDSVKFSAGEAIPCRFLRASLTAIRDAWPRCGWFFGRLTSSCR